MPAGFKSVGWMLEDEGQFENLHKRLHDADVAFEELSAFECELHEAARITRAMELYSHATLEFFTPAKVQTPATSFAFTHTKIRRLGHIMWATPQQNESIAFFRDVLNFRQSDSIGEAFTFMRPFPNPFHHGIGICRSVRQNFHHLNFMVSEIDDIGKAQNRMKRNHVPIVFGPGRHPASNSVFLYFLEPDGMTLEFSFGMEEFTEADHRKRRTLPMQAESIDTWGSERDPRMGQTGEIEIARPLSKVV